MCGISGWIGWAGVTPPALGLDLLAHRGPDDRGVQAYLSASGRVVGVLGATRLAVIDLSAAGHMPMEHPEEPLSLVYNGEIYNFLELRRELEGAGERFHSRTDTEVVLRGYRVWGAEVVTRLRGMFAFALWDGRGDGSLFLARDRFGKKPLYFRVEPGQGLAFASELKALLRSGGPRELDPDSLEYFLDRGYPPPHRCLLRGYQKVRAGCLMVWEGGRLRERRYWEIPPPDAAGKARSWRQAGPALRERLLDATRRRLVADVPVGLLLSGGVDSGSLLALMAALTPEPVRTFTACFGGAGLDESDAAWQTARCYGARHRALLINPRCGRLLPFVAAQMDEPIADPSALATYLICRRAREEVTVLLTGDGSDELFFGYPRYRLHGLAHLLHRAIPPGLRQAAGRLLPPGSLVERTLSAPPEPLKRDRYWLRHGSRPPVAFSWGDPGIPLETAVLQVQREDLTSWLVEDILVKVDKMSMAASVEVRAPYLDQEVAALALHLPARWHLGGGRGKRLLAEAVRGLAPAHLSWSRKRPFHLPINDWLRCEWRPLARDVLLDPRFRTRGWVDLEEVQRLLAEQETGQGRHGRRLYQLLVLELWARAILDRGEAEPHPASTDDCVRELDPQRPLRQVAVVAPAGIGDTVRLTPGLKELGRRDPNVSVTLYVAQGRESDQVMAGLPPVDRQVPINFTRPGMGKFWALLRDLRGNPPALLVSTLISRFSWVLGALAGIRDRRSWVPQWSLAMRLNRFFWRRPHPYNPRQRDVGRQDIMEFCGLLGVAPPEPLSLTMAAPLWEEQSLRRARQRLAQLPRPRLAVNAVAQAAIRQRQYPLARLAAALAALLDRGVVNSVILLGDAYSRSWHRPLHAVLGPRGLDCSGELSLGASAAVLRECEAVLTIDGGLLHVALATPLPVAALYGPTEIFVTDPRGVPDSYAALSAFPRCRCLCLNQRGIKVQPQCREGSQCLATLEPDRVAAVVADLLARRPPAGGTP